MSKFNVTWSLTALKEVTQTADYIFENFGLKSARDFEQKLTQLTISLSDNKALCPKSKKLSFRKCVVTKQSSLIYFVNKDEIRIITLIDNRSLNAY